jgi:hypothetical protein
LTRLTRFTGLKPEQKESEPRPSAFGLSTIPAASSLSTHYQVIQAFWA